MAILECFTSIYKQNNIKMDCRDKIQLKNGVTFYIDKKWRDLSSHVKRVKVLFW